MGRCLSLQNSATCLGFSLNLMHVMLFFLACLTVTVFLVELRAPWPRLQLIHSEMERLAAVDGLLDFCCLSSHYRMLLAKNKVR